MPHLSRPKHPLTSQRNKLLCEGFKKGKSPKELAKQFNISIRAVNKWLSYYGLQNGPKHFRIPQQIREAVIAKWPTTLTREEIAVELKIHPRTVRKIAADAKLPPRKQGRRKMSKPRPPKPIESFGPELFRALIEGAKRRIEFELPYRKAVHFRQRANQLRNEMRKQGHEQANVVSQAKITISWPDSAMVNRSSRNVRHPSDPNTPCTVTIAPADSEFSDVLKTAGVEVPTLTPSTEPTPGGYATVEEDILAQYLTKVEKSSP